MRICLEIKWGQFCNIFVSLQWAQQRAEVKITELKPQISSNWWRAHQTRPQHHWTRGAAESCNQGSCEAWSVKNTVKNTELFSRCDRAWDLCSERVHLLDRTVHYKQVCFKYRHLLTLSKRLSKNHTFHILTSLFILCSNSVNVS